MWQRIQTLFLLGVAFSMLTLLNLRIWVKVGDGAQAVLTSFYLTEQRGEAQTRYPSFYIAILAVAAAGLAFYNITQFSDRLKQIKLNLINTLLIAGCLGCMVYFSMAKGERLFLPDERGAYQLGFYVPVIALFFNSLANRFIKRDEDLVRSADRMR